MKELQFGKEEINTPILTYNALDKSHTISGFGGQIWMGDSRAIRIAEDQGWSMVRMSIEDKKPDGSKPGLSKPNNLRAEYDTYWNQFNTERIKNLHTILASKRITPIYVQFGIDRVWLDNDKNKNFVGSYVNELAEYWAAHVVWMKKNGVTPKYIELFNEPDYHDEDGNGNGYVKPSDYNSIVKAVRRILDERDCSATRIVGPGRAHFDVEDPDEWVDKLDADGIRAIDAWSIHSYEWGSGPEDSKINNPQYVRDNWKGFLNSVKAKDPSHSKPIFLTEHATKCTTFHAHPYADEKGNADNFASNTQYYGVRVFENALSFINMGANSIIVWQACDQAWNPEKFWGMEKLDGTKRPVYYAMKTLSTVVPSGAFVLKSPPQAKTGIYATAFTTGDRFIAAFANGTAESGNVTVNVNNASISFLKAEAMINGAIESKLLTVANNSFIVDLPRDSTLVVTLALSR
jgi:O-glycosyl hydrolase